MRVQRETETGYMTISAALPAVVSVTKSANEPRYPSLKGIMAARSKEVATKSAADLYVSCEPGALLTGCPAQAARREITNRVATAEKVKLVAESAKLRAGLTKLFMGTTSPRVCINRRTAGRTLSVT